MADRSENRSSRRSSRKDSVKSSRMESTKSSRQSSEKSSRQDSKRKASKRSTKSGKSSEKEKLLETSANGGKTLVWKDIEASVPIASKGKKKDKKEGGNEKEEKRKTVLRQVSGAAKPREVLAIMGGSGAGKTTLMNILAFLDSKGVEKKGTVLVDGIEMTKTEVRAMSAYVQQVDVFVGTLTVREQLTYSALLRMGSKYTKKQKMERVEEVIREMNLTDCQKTIIGVPNKVKGVSIGEKKRLAFACEVLTDPAILFCDEPTSGLDAFMASQVVSTMRMLADKGKTVISVIHQPSSTVFNRFHKVLFMANGRTAYHGPVSELCNFFSEIEMPVPESHNPADHAITKLAVIPESKDEDVKRIEKITAHFEGGEHGKGMKKFVSDSFANKAKQGDSKTRPKTSYASSFFVQFWILLRRSFLTTLRDPMLLKVRLVQVIITAAVIAVVYFNMKVDGGSVQNFEGLLYNTARDMNFLFLAPSINCIASELPVLLREHKAHIYSTLAYYLAKSTAELPQYTVLPFLYSVIVYWATGLIRTAGGFFFYNLVSTLMVWNALSVAYAFAFAFGDEGAAITYAPLLIIPMLVLGGFYINFSAVPIYMKWLGYLSWFRFGFEPLQLNQWEPIDVIEGCGLNETVVNLHCPGPNGGESVLERRGMLNANKWIDVLILFSFVVGYRIIGYIALLLRSRFAK